MASSPFSSFSAKEFQDQPNALSQGSTLSNLKPAAAAAGLDKTTPARPVSGDANAMRTDVYRSYSLLDVAFWDFGNREGGTFLSRWFGSPPKPIVNASPEPIDKGSDGSQSTFTQRPATAASSSYTWGKWFGN